MEEFVIKSNVLVKYNGRTKEVKIPDGVEKIDGSVFSSRKSIKTVVIPASVKEIGYGAFEECLALEQVSFSEDLELIDWSAFSGCKSLKTITIPASVKGIGDSAFYGCTSLEQVDLSEGLEQIGRWAFPNCESLKSVIIPVSVKEIGSMAFGGCSKTTVYCRSKKELDGWSGEWSDFYVGDKIKVIWGYKGE